MIAMFFNQTLPSSIGGDAIRIWLVSKHSNWRSAIYSVFLDRLIGVISLAVVVLVCLPWTLELIRDPIGRAALLLIGLGCLGAGTAFVGLAWKQLHVLQRWSFPAPPGRARRCRAGDLAFAAFLRPRVWSFSAGASAHRACGMVRCSRHPS